MTQMYGYALSTIDDVADHTWVYTADGFCCGCPDKVARGCSDDDRKKGYIVCQADGNVGNAGCMAGPYDTRFFIPYQCGVVYAINGLCHQMANRILLATGRTDVTVVKANGSWFSFFTYGTWGTLIPESAFYINTAAAIALSFTVVSDFRGRCRTCNVSPPVLADPQALAGISIRTEGVALSEQQRILVAQAQYEHAEQHIGELCDQLEGKASADRLQRVKEIFTASHRPQLDLLLGTDPESAAAVSREEMARRIDAANASARKPLTVSGTSVSDAQRTTPLPICWSAFFSGEKCSTLPTCRSPITTSASPARIGAIRRGISLPGY